MERLTTAETARRLGVSPTQVRRLAASGRLVAEQERRPQGTRLVILWDAPGDAPGTPPDAPKVATEDATLVRWLKDRLEAAEVERAELRRLLFQAYQDLTTARAQLPAPRAPESESDVQERVAERTRPWWQPWRRR
jgi:hypothetical protein